MSFRQSKRRLVLVGCFLAFAVLGQLSSPLLSLSAAGQADGVDSSVEVEGQLPLLDPTSDLPRPAESELHTGQGWLLIDSSLRRGYEVSRIPGQTFRGDTALWSVDLDTLAPLRRAVIRDFEAITGGVNPGDVVHAVDEEGGKLLLGGLTTAVSVLGEVAVAVIDEAKLAAGAADFATILRIPVSQRTDLAGKQLYGMSFHKQGNSGKVLLLFGQTANTQVNDHRLVQWDVQTGAADWSVSLTPCQRSPLIGSQSWSYPLAILRAESTIYLGCQGERANGLAVKIPLDEGIPDPDTSKWSATPLPRIVANVLADPASERLIFMTESNGISWWVYDGQSESWVGSMGSVLWTGYRIAAGIDTETGNLYTLAPDHARRTEPPQPVQGGLQVTNVRLTPAPQFTNASSELAYPGHYRIVVDSIESPGIRFFVRRGDSNPSFVTPTYPSTENDTPRPRENFYTVINDSSPIPPDPGLADLDSNTLDVPEGPGVTGAKFDGSAAGFGMRTLMTGGINALVARDLDDVFTSSCFKNDRELTVAGINQAQLSNLAGQASSLSLSVDENTKNDLNSPGSRCWPEPLGTDLPPGAGSPVDTLAGQEWENFSSECEGDDADENDSSLGPITLVSEASCVQTEYRVSASSAASLAQNDDPYIKVAHGFSSLTSFRDPVKGMVVQVESGVSGLELDEGRASIALIRTVAETWAHGRPGSAGSRYLLTMCGIQLPDLNIPGCVTDDHANQIVDGLNRVLNRNGKARLRKPDREYEVGSPGGYLAAIQRDRREAYADETVSRDASKTVPGLEIIVFRNDDPSKGAGRQIYQFAGVQASSAYGIFCLFGETSDETCIKPNAELSIILTDDSSDPKPLSGGVFEVHQDLDENGVLGVDDPVLKLGDDDAICVTDQDGTGDCKWDLAPGAYIVHQTAAPAGYSPSSDCIVELSVWTSQTCNFRNLEAIGKVDIRLIDDTAGQPLGGAGFEVFEDNGDSAIGPADLKVATCRTDASGNCVFTVENAGVLKGVELGRPESPAGLVSTNTGSEATSTDTVTGATDTVTVNSEANKIASGETLLVPLGTYVIRESEPPSDYAASGDEAISLTTPGQKASLTFVNGLKGTDGTLGFGGSATSHPTSVLFDDGGNAPTPEVTSEPVAQPEETGIVGRVIRVPAEAMRFLIRHPKEAILFAAMWMLLAGPLVLGWRRRSILNMGGS